MKVSRLFHHGDIFTNYQSINAWWAYVSDATAKQDDDPRKQGEERECYRQPSGSKHTYTERRMGTKASQHHFNGTRQSRIHRRHHRGGYENRNKRYL